MIRFYLSVDWSSIYNVDTASIKMTKYARIYLYFYKYKIITIDLQVLKTHSEHNN